MTLPTGPEIATATSDPYVPNFQGVMAPTDEVLASRGGAGGLKIYDEIRRDPHAFAVLQKRKLEVCSREWQVFEASDRRLDKKAAAEVERQIKGIDFDRLTRGLMGAVLKGFSVAEVMWGVQDGIWTVVGVKVKKQRRFRFMLDGSLRILTRAHPVDGEAVPDRKFIVHRHSIDDDDDDPYGVGIGSVLFWPAWFKRQALAHWLRGTEKHATPTTVAQYAGPYDKKRQDEILAALRQMANDTGIVVPDNVTVALLEAKNGGGGDFIEKLNRYLDELMSEAVLGETLSTNSGERGARSLGEIHNEVRVAIAKADADLVSRTLKETIVRWIVELNYPGAALPDVWRDFSEAEDLDAKVKRDDTIVKMGYKPKDVEYINDTYGGDWVERATEAPEPGQELSPGQVPTPGVTAGLDFADNPQRRQGDEVVDTLSGQLDSLATPILDSMIEAIRAEFTEARDYDDLILRLARLSSELGVDDLATLVEQSTVLARLEGHASVSGRNG